MMVEEGKKREKTFPFIMERKKKGKDSILFREKEGKSFSSRKKEERERGALSLGRKASQPVFYKEWEEGEKG